MADDSPDSLTSGPRATFDEATVETIAQQFHLGAILHLTALQKAEVAVRLHPPLMSNHGTPEQLFTWTQRGERQSASMSLPTPSTGV